MVTWERVEKYDGSCAYDILRINDGIIDMLFPFLFLAAGTMTRSWSSLSKVRKVTKGEAHTNCQNVDN
jgi:hypothetical protein